MLWKQSSKISKLTNGFALRDYIFYIPFYIDVTHIFASNAGFIQNYVRRVPNNDAQKKPDRKNECEYRRST